MAEREVGEDSREEESDTKHSSDGADPLQGSHGWASVRPPSFRPAGEWARRAWRWSCCRSLKWLHWDGRSIEGKGKAAWEGRLRQSAHQRSGAAQAFQFGAAFGAGGQ